MRKYRVRRVWLPSSMLPRRGKSNSKMDKPKRLKLRNRY